MRALRLLAILSLAQLPGCATIGYYAQAVGGQLDILARSRPIAELLDGPPPASSDTWSPPAPALRARLETVLRIRAFASQALGLPDNGSYTTYADLERSMVAWNVIATPEFSLQPREWCYPFAGCVPYRGYFSRAAAEREAVALRQEGLDVRVAGVAAYSTLGWFRDPVISTQLRQSDTDLAALVFHELAHQQVYVPGDAGFNESFATTVEIEGLRRWQTAIGDPAAFETYQRERRRQREFVDLMMRYRERLAALYDSALDDAAKRVEKQRILDELQAEYPRLTADWGGDERYAGWFAHRLNNAHLASIELYHEFVPAFQALLAASGSDLLAFYRAAQTLGELPEAERHARLTALNDESASSVGAKN